MDIPSIIYLDLHRRLRGAELRFPNGCWYSASAHLDVKSLAS
jgi:hypothetical protein